MPNHIVNHISLHGDPQKIREILEAIQSDEIGIGSVDFNKVIPMPKSLDIESGTRTDRGLKAYRGFIEVYTFGRSADDTLKALENIPVNSEEVFLRQRTDIRRDEWMLGKTAWHNIRQYGAPTWYDWCVSNWGTKWNAYGYNEEPIDYHDGDMLYFQTAWSAPHPVLEKLAEMFPDVKLEHEWADEDIGQNCGRYSYQGGERIEEYQQIELLGKSALFTNDRLMDADIPQGLYCYHLRHSDDGGRFCSVEPKVGVNHGGSVITKEPLDFGTEGYISFTEDTEPNFTSEEQTLGEFLRSDEPQENEVMKLC